MYCIDSFRFLVTECKYCIHYSPGLLKSPKSKMAKFLTLRVKQLVLSRPKKWTLRPDWLIWNFGLFTTDDMNKIRFNLILEIVITALLFSCMRSRKTFDLIVAETRLCFWSLLDIIRSGAKPERFKFAEKLLILNCIILGSRVTLSRFHWTHCVLCSMRHLP